MNVDETRACLALEREEERLESLHASASLDTREIERRGVGIGRLRIESVETGLFGRAVRSLTRPLPHPMPPHTHPSPSKDPCTGPIRLP